MLVAHGDSQRDCEDGCAACARSLRGGFGPTCCAIAFCGGICSRAVRDCCSSWSCVASGCCHFLFASARWLFLTSRSTAQRALSHKLQTCLLTFPLFHRILSLRLRLHAKIAEVEVKTGRVLDKQELLMYLTRVWLLRAGFGGWYSPPAVQPIFVPCSF